MLINQIDKTLHNSCVWSNVVDKVYSRSYLKGHSGNTSDFISSIRARDLTFLDLRSYFKGQGYK